MTKLLTPVLPLAAAALLAAATLAAPARPADAAIDRGAPREVQRLRTHFAQVERELLARDVSMLTASQRAARARHVEVLREYAAAGVFPHNHHHRQATPYFVDEHGTHCAMAYLIARSGRGDLVRKVAATRSNAYVRELVDDPELVAWLDANGLTAAEAARIQPAYEPPPPIDEGDPDEARMRYLVPAFTVGATNLAMTLMNATADHPAPKWPARVGILAGAVGVALGISGLSQEQYREVGTASTFLGMVSAAVGVRTLLVPRPEDRLSVLTATPLVSADGVGVNFSARF